MTVSQPIFESNPTHPSCHAATLVECAGGDLLAAWFAGTHEGHPDVAIWLSRYDGARWSEPRITADVPGTPLWNPVLLRDRADTVWLFYKAGPGVPSWTGLYRKSFDEGRTWSAPVALPAGLVGPVKNKPLVLSNGDILCGSSSETWRSWSCWVEISGNGGETWSRHGPIVAPGHPGVPGDPGTEPAGGGEPISALWDVAAQTLLLPQRHYGVIQPAVWEHAPGRLKMLMRATQRVGYVCAASSCDYGRTWSAASLTEIPCPNSGLDAVRLDDGRVVVICNPTREGRTPLSLLASEDNGETWPWRLDVETGPGEYSYPSIIQASDGRLHAVYTYRRAQIRHLTLNLDEVRVTR